MVFICEKNYYYGFVSAGGRRYTFSLTVSENLHGIYGSQGKLKVEYRLYRDLGNSLKYFLKNNSVFDNPQEFYNQFNDFVKSNIKTPKRIQTWLQHPLKVAVLVKSLEQEIGKVEKYIKYFDLETGVVKIEVTDCYLRIHKADLKLSLNYKNEPISVISHDLPQQKSGEECSLNLDNIYSLAEFCEKFVQLVNCFQPFWNLMGLIDSQCFVLDPVNPTFKHVFRRIKLTNTVSVVLTFNPYYSNQRPKIKLLGCQSEVNHYEMILQNNLENDSWDNEEDLLFNLSNALEVTIPSKIFVEESECLDLAKTEECAICFTYQLADTIPNEICENPTCKTMYHSSCLFTYLSSFLRNRDYFGKIQGECPNCDEIISCAVPKLL